jgi:hypothetical protein
MKESALHENRLAGRESVGTLAVKPENVSIAVFAKAPEAGVGGDARATACFRHHLAQTENLVGFRPARGSGAA